ncbi:MAG: carboxypeptidase regulatory-like domain-containing protein [Candidatus Limimorpha sp.]
MKKVFLLLTMVLGIMLVQAQVGVKVTTDAQQGSNYQFGMNVVSPKAAAGVSGDAVVVWNISEEYAIGGEIYISDEIDGNRRTVNNWTLNDSRIETYLNESQDVVWDFETNYAFTSLFASKDCELILIVDNPNLIALNGDGEVLNDLVINDNSVKVAVRPDGIGYYVSIVNSSGNTDVSYYKKESTTAEWTITIDGRAVAMNVSETNNRLLVGVSSSNTIYVIDGEEGDIIQDDIYYYNNSPTQSPAISANGDYIAFADFSGKGTLMKWNGERYDEVWSASLSRSGESSTWGAAQAISPDGKYVAFGTLGFISSGYQGTIFLFNNYSSTPEWIYTDCGDEVKYISFNGDGTLFACAGMGAMDNSTSDLWIFRPQSDNPYMELNTPGSMNVCSFSPDGKYVTVTGKAVHDRDMGWGGNAYLINTAVATVGTLSGTTDVINGLVTINELDDYYVRTNNDGTFSMSYIPEGVYSVTITCVGYEPLTLQDVVINGGETTIINADLNSLGSPVTNLYATQNESPTTVNLVWNEYEGECQGYAVYRKESFDAPFEQPLGTTYEVGFSDNTAIPTHEYFYAVTAIIDEDAQTPFSNISMGCASTTFLVTEADAYEGTAPTIDGQKGADEWNDAFIFDISDFTGKTNEIEPAGSVLAYVKMNGGKLYFAVEVFTDETLNANDCVALYWDDNCDRQYPVKNETNPDDSEGNFWMKYTGSGTSMTYRPLYDGGSVGTTIDVPDAELEFGMVDGHVFVEFSFVIGNETYNITPVNNRSGMYMYYRSEGSDYMAYWPYNNKDTFNPIDYNTVVFNVEHVAPEAPQNLRVDLGYSEFFATLLWDAVECNNFDHYAVNINGEDVNCYGTSLLFAYEPNTTYNIYIKTIDHSGLQSPASETLTFTTGAMSMHETDANLFELYPNPADSKVIIAGTEINFVEVINVSGQIVGRYNVVNNVVIISTENLEPGVYFVIINGNTTKKLIVR